MWTHCANRIWLKIRHLAIAQKEFELSSLVNDPLRKKNLHCVKRITIAHLEFPLRKKNFFQILKFYYTLRIFASLSKKNLSFLFKQVCTFTQQESRFRDCYVELSFNFKHLFHKCTFGSFYIFWDQILSSLEQFYTYQSQVQTVLCQCLSRSG